MPCSPGETLTCSTALRLQPGERGFTAPPRPHYRSDLLRGKRHNAVVICLARRRCNVIFAMLKNGTYYQPPAPVPTPEPTALAG